MLEDLYELARKRKQGRLTSLDKSLLSQSYEYMMQELSVDELSSDDMASILDEYFGIPDTDDINSDLEIPLSALENIIPVIAYNGFPDNEFIVSELKKYGFYSEGYEDYIEAIKKKALDNNILFNNDGDEEKLISLFNIADEPLLTVNEYQKILDKRNAMIGVYENRRSNVMRRLNERNIQYDSIRMSSDCASAYHKGHPVYVVGEDDMN